MPALDFPPTPPVPRAKREPPTIPPLENGDHLSGEEFMRRYEAMPDVKAELINGIVHTASPVRHTQHSSPHLLLSGWLSLYLSRTPDLIGGDNGSVILSPSLTVQPDLYLMLPPDRGGKARLGDDDYVHGPPELVIEIAGSTASVDANEKADAYREAGVGEYLLWRTEDVAIDWFVLEGGAYRAVEPDADGCLSGRAFDGLVLDRPALLRGDLAAVLARLDRRV